MGRWFGFGEAYGLREWGGVRQDWQVVLGNSYKFDCLAAV